MSSSPLDAETLASIRALGGDDGDEFLREIVGIFLEDTPLRFKELNEALAAGDMTRFARAAHSIKGSSSNVGAFDLRNLAEVIEQQAHLGMGGTYAAIERLQAEFDRAKQALNELVR